MSDNVIMDAEEKQKFAEFKKKINREAALAQVNKLEYNLTDAAIDKGALRRACQDANSLGIGGVCVFPCFVKACVSFLGADPKTALIACISYPHGADTTQIKAAAVKRAVKDGVDEVEVTAPIAYVKDGNWSYVRREFKKLKSAAKNRTVRINIESRYLTKNEISRLSNLAADCGITSLRTCSGEYGGGFDPDVVSQIKSSVKDKCTVKVDGVTTATEMNIAVDMGAGIIGSKNAADLARLIIKSAED